MRVSMLANWSATTWLPRSVWLTLEALHMVALCVSLRAVSIMSISLASAQHALALVVHCNADDAHVYFEGCVGCRTLVLALYWHE